MNLINLQNCGCNCSNSTDTNSELSAVTQRYLTCFGDILDQMICGMTHAEVTNSVSHNFIMQMIPHHEAAIRMCKNLLRYTTFQPLEEIAQNIITEQTAGIASMRQILPCCSYYGNTYEECSAYQTAFREISDDMFTQMQTAQSVNDINTDFINEMIPHHEGAIKLCENALTQPICPSLTPILENIIATQTQGVTEMQALLNRN